LAAFFAAFASVFAAVLRAGFSAGSADAARAGRAGRAARGARSFSAGSASAIGSSVCPIAADSMTTTSDQRMWYVEASEYGRTCAFGRLRPLR
jgi:hypothetical protein